MRGNGKHNRIDIRMQVKQPGGWISVPFFVEISLYLHAIIDVFIPMGAHHNSFPSDNFRTKPRLWMK